MHAWCECGWGGRIEQETEERADKAVVGWKFKENAYRREVFTDGRIR